MNRRKHPYVIAAAITLLWSCLLHAQETVFFTGFEYDTLPTIFEPIDLNGAADQIGEWSGPEFGDGQPSSIPTPDAAGIAPSPFGGSLFVLDRPTGDFDTGDDRTGSYFADFSKAIPLLGAEVAFDVGTRRTQGNNEKDYSIIGRDSNGVETFNVRVGTNNNNGERLGVVTNGGESLTFDLPTVVGEDRGGDLDNMGGFNITDGPNFGQEIANVLLRLGTDGFVIDFSYPPEATSGFANSYRTSLLEYNGDGVDLAQLEITYEASTNDGRNSGYVLDNIMVSGFEDLLQGDFNSDGTLDEADYLVMSANFGTGSTYAEGDFDFDGSITVADFIGLKAAFLEQSQVASVPEPMGAFMLFSGLGFLLCCRRKRLGAVAVLLLALAFTCSSTKSSLAQPGEILGTGTESLIGGDLTDPEDDGEADEDIGYNATFRSNLEPGFGGGEFSFNVFDNLLGGGNAKWCCGDNTLIMEPEGLWVEAELESPVVLNRFTVSSANDVPGRDPIRWAVLGSNDGVEYETIFSYEEGESLWDERLQVRLFTGGSAADDFELPDPYRIFRLATFETGSTTFQIGEIEFFGLDFEITPGDFNSDGSVDRLDYAILRDNFGDTYAGISAAESFAMGDFNFDLAVDMTDFAGFRDLFTAAEFAAIPEPSSNVLFALSSLLLLAVNRRRSSGGKERIR